MELRARVARRCSSEGTGRNRFSDLNGVIIGTSAIAKAFPCATFFLVTAMRRQAGSTLALRLAGQFAMGACLGTFLAMALIVGNVQRVFDKVVNSATPSVAMAVLVVTFASMFAIGATLTGLLFIMTEED